MFHISLLALPALCTSSSSESACIRKEQEIVCDVVGIEQLEMTDAPPASSCPSLHSAGGSFSPPHLRLSFLLAFLFPIPPSDAMSRSGIIMNIDFYICFFGKEPCICDVVYLLEHKCLVFFQFHLFIAPFLFSHCCYLSIQPSSPSFLFASPPPTHTLALAHTITHTHTQIRSYCVWQADLRPAV